MFKTTKILHGGDYNPEQWLGTPEILDKDLEFMKEAKINTVTLGVFSWGVLEPAEGEFHFQWLEDIIERLYQEGISTILATPSGARPKWLADKYPEVLRTREDRTRMLFGARHNHCLTSPVYREKVRIIDQELARRFGSHPGVILWHISNELGGDCHCPLCQEAFRDWLRKRYGTISELNARWCTTFWSHQYQSFDQIESPSSIGESSLHGLNLDWKRFVTDQTVDFTEHEIRSIRETGSDKPSTVNMMPYYDGLDYHKFSDVVDVTSWDSYPAWHKEAESLTAEEAGMFHDVIRSLKKAPFLLMESSPSATNWQQISKLRKPGILKLASLHAVAHGSDSVLYFQIRQSRGASEKFHGAIIDHYGKLDTRIVREARDLGEELEKLAEVTCSAIPAQAAVIYDWESKWAMEDAQGPRNQGLGYRDAVRKAYSGLRRLGLNVDMINMDQEIEGYRIVAAPMTYMFRPGFAEKVEQFVQNGGTFVLTYWAGVVDENDRTHLGGRPFGLLDVMGFRSTEIDGLFDWDSNTFEAAEGNVLGLSKSYTCTKLCELVELSGAEALMNYGADFYAGTAAVTRHTYGKGKAYGILADADRDFYEDFMEKLVHEAVLDTPIQGVLPEGVEASLRMGAHAYLFLQNFGRGEKRISLSEGGWEVISCDKNRGSEECLADDGHEVSLKEFETVVLKK